MYKPLDRIGLYGQDPGNDLQSEGTYYCVAGHSGQGARRSRHLLPQCGRLLSYVPSGFIHAVLHAGSWLRGWWAWKRCWGAGNVTNSAMCNTPCCSASHSRNQRALCTQA